MIPEKLILHLEKESNSFQESRQTSNMNKGYGYKKYPLKYIVIGCCEFKLS